MPSRHKTVKVSAEAWAKAQAHEIRQRIIMTMAVAIDPMSPSALAEELDERLGNISYHVRTLNDLGVIGPAGTRPRRGAVEHYYELLITPESLDETLGFTREVQTALAARILVA